MNNTVRGNSHSTSPAEKISQKLLMEKMGMSKKELHEVNAKYGVSAAQLLEIMQLSKYEFVYNGKVPGQCEPCSVVGRMQVVNF